MNDYFDKLNQFNDEIGTIVIDQAFINFRNRMKDKFKVDGRDELKRLMAADCLIAEYALIDGGYVFAPETDEIRYDFKLDDAYFDVKFIDTKYFNIPIGKLDWYVKNIMAGMLTHFAFYRYIDKPESCLNVGDKIQLQLLEVEDARTVIKNICVSNDPDNGYYYRVKNCTLPTTT